MVEKHDIKLEILNKSTHLNQSRTQINVMSELFFCEGFSLGHVVITMIIKKTHFSNYIWLISGIKKANLIHLSFTVELV